MGACSSKNSAAVLVSPDVLHRRMLRKTSSAEELQRAVAEYHASAPRHISPKLERFRPAPIPIRSPNSFDERKAIVANEPVAVGKSIGTHKSIDRMADMPLIESPFLAALSNPSSTSSTGRD